MTPIYKYPNTYVPKNRMAAGYRVDALRTQRNALPWWRFHAIYTLTKQIRDICAYHGFSE